MSSEWSGIKLWRSVFFKREKSVIINQSSFEKKRWIDVLYVIQTGNLNSNVWHRATDCKVFHYEYPFILYNWIKCWNSNTSRVSNIPLISPITFESVLHDLPLVEWFIGRSADTLSKAANEIGLECNEECAVWDILQAMKVDLKYLLQPIITIIICHFFATGVIRHVKSLSNANIAIDKSNISDIQYFVCIIRLTALFNL